MESTAKILVVDDEKRICLNVEKILSKNNFEVIHAVNAQEALEKMAVESFSLLISDIVMPGMNGLELLKLVKDQWPLTKALIMTAYASTDTAVKAIRLGALDYIPKPFTPDELRTKVDTALTEKIIEVSSTKEEKEVIDVIDIDIPFEGDEVAKYTGEDYVAKLGRSDMPIIEAPKPETLKNFCVVGDMVCEIYKKLDGTCKGGLKTSECPQKKAKKKKAAKGKEQRTDTKKLIGIDMPFNYDEVVSVTGPEYVANLRYEGVSFLSYEELKKSVAKMTEKHVIDVDAPFDAEEVAKITGHDYVKALQSSDMPVVEPLLAKTPQHFCEQGDMVCDIYKKMGGTCKAGIKTAECPRKKAQKRKAAKRQRADIGKFIGVDMPFDYEEVAAVTGPGYVASLRQEGVTVLPYEELKRNVAQMMPKPSERPVVQIADYLDLPVEPVHKNILVIDDEVAVNNNIRKILAKNNYHVDQAVTKYEALEKLENRQYKVVLLDLKIPDVKGLELLEAVRDKNPNAKVIIITGYASIDTAVETARMGAIDYLPKPFTPGEIRNVTDKAFRIAA